MSTVDHILAACGQVRVAWGWLATSLEPGRTRRNQRQLTQQAQERRNRQASEDRAGRHLLMNGGKVITGHSGTPASLSAIEARDRIAQDFDAAAWQVASHLRNQVAIPYRAGQPAYRPNGTNADTRFRTAVDWVSTNAPRLHDHGIINDTYRALCDANTLARSVTGEGPQRRPLAAECPACGRRSLAWDTGSSNYTEWHVTCTRDDCRCDGRDCNCRLAERQPGMVHLWTEASWERLAQQLNDKETTR